MPAPRFSIRLKLTIGSLLPLIVTILFCSLAGTYLITTRINVLAQEKVRTDLNSAREIYSNEVSHVRDVVRFTAGMPLALQALTGENRFAAAPFLSSLRREEQLDVLTMVDRRGRVLYRAGNPEVFDDDLGEDHLVRRALQGRVSAGSAIFAADRLLLEGRQLANRAAIEVIPTAMARPGAKKTERSGMLLVAAAPVRDQKGEVVGALYGAVLLNGNNTVVDKIKRIVYEGVQFEGKDVGNATIFLGDTRISTNVQTYQGNRAIGTRLSEEVYKRVIVNGEKWVDRAFVVNDWYFSAYEPILGLTGEVIGSLYVGMREQPNTAMKNKVTLIFGGVLLAGTLFGLAVSALIGNHLSRPIRELRTLVHRFSAGERGLRIETESGDEIGELAREFNAMTGTLMERETAIHELNRSLGLKVQERTAELEAKNQLLMKTLQELVRVEKLAAVGELAAGVAHEINNPMAIIRGNAEVLLMELAPDHPSREEAEIIAQEVGRVAGIVGNLLSFARKQRKAVKRVALDRILEEILRQVGHQVPLDGIEVRRELSLGAAEINGDENQLRQVLTNLIVNAVQSMDKGGILTVRSWRDQETGACRVEIADTGDGIPAEQIKDIFTPFFTTKQSGTGLGLSVSYGIIENHGGAITVKSSPGEGSTFTVMLPGGGDAKVGA